jgi:hypothetical protein
MLVFGWIVNFLLPAVCMVFGVGICLTAMVDLAVGGYLRWRRPEKWANRVAEVTSPSTRWFQCRPVVRGVVYAAFVFLVGRYAVGHWLGSTATAPTEGGTQAALLAVWLGVLLFLIGFNRPKWRRLAGIAEIWPPVMFSLSWIVISAVCVFRVWGSRLLMAATGVQGFLFAFFFAATAVAAWVLGLCIAADLFNVFCRRP